MWHFCGVVGLAGVGLRSVGANGELPIQERVLYPAPRSPFIGLGLGLRAYSWYSKSAVVDVGFMVSEKRRPQQEERLLLRWSPTRER